MTRDEWLVAAKADADRRQLTDLKPLLDALATATRALRGAVWNRHADGPPDPATALPGPDADGAAS